MKDYKCERISWVKAEMFKGDNEEEIEKLLKYGDAVKISTAKTKMWIKEKRGTEEDAEIEVSVLLMDFEHKDTRRKLTIHEGMFLVVTTRGFKIMNYEQFFKQYSEVKNEGVADNGMD